MKSAERFSIIALLIIAVNSSYGQSILYKGNPFKSQLVLKPNFAYDIKTSICHNSTSENVVYAETQRTKTDVNGFLSYKIGEGKVLIGQIDSVIWSDGSYFLKFESDTSKTEKKYFSSVIQLRAPTEINQNNLEGFASDDSSKGWGSIMIQHNKNKRPKKITVDLSTSYINIAYKGGNYPIYRHYEWYDEDRNGLGNSFMLTYSEKTNHEFFENSKKIGEVKLYEKPFQELFIKSIDNNKIEIELTRPQQITNLSETYAIKGPWKIIYFIEW